jgi:predicted PolB exonuclease-like 3'-5' exonuclease
MSMVESNCKFPKLPVYNMNNVKIYASDKILLTNYLEKFRKSGPDHVIAIARSNRMVNIINRAMRRAVYGDLDLPMEKNDVMLITYNNFAVPLVNGDFAMICEIGERQDRSGLHFQKIKIKSLLSDTEFEILISLDILNGKEINFTKKQQNILMTDFNRRMKLKEIKRNSDDYEDAMKEDEYLNCPFPN